MKLKYNKSSLATVIALVSLAALAPSCSSSDDSSSGTAGTGGTSSGGHGGSAGHAGTSTGTGGTIGGTGGATAGTGGTTSGTGGASTAGTGGASTAGTGGATAGTGGAAAGTGGAAAGTGGTGGAHQGGMAGDIGEGGEAGAPASIPCGGCAVLTAPLNTLTAPLPASLPNTDLLSIQTTFNPTNLTGVTLTLRACVVNGDVNSAVQIYVQDGAAQSYAGDFGVFFKTFNNVSNCSVGMQDLTLAVASSGTFDATVVTSVSVQILPAGTAGPWVASTLYVDSITATGDAIGPWNFTSNASVFALQTSIPGGSLSWIP